MTDVQKEQRKKNEFDETQKKKILNVVVEKKGNASAKVHGDLSKEALRELLMSQLSLIPETKSNGRNEITTLSENEILKTFEEEIQETSKTHEDSFSESENLVQYLETENRNQDFDTYLQERSEGEENKEEIETLQFLEDRGENKDTEIKKLDDKSEQEKSVNLEDSKILKTDFSETESNAEVFLNEFLIGEFDKKEEEEENLNFSEDCQWLMKYLKKPLVLGLKEIIKKKPHDPINYLGFWFLNYRNCEKEQNNEMGFEYDL